MNFPTLYKKTSTGKIQMWKIEVVPMADKSATIITTYGQTDGAEMIATDRIWIGKNIGKANETTAVEQAFSEAGSTWDRKKKKGYVENYEQAQAGEVDTSVILGGAPAMLAHKFSEQGHKIKYPCFVQPKLDGHRCIAVIKDGSCTLWSRNRHQIFGVPHIQRELEQIFPVEKVGSFTITLDGELYNHDYRNNFEALSSYIRQVTPTPGHEIVQYWVYDMVDPDGWYFSDRISYITEEIGFDHKYVVEVETTKVHDEDELMDVFGHCIGMGFEGAMARNTQGPYVGRRSYDLQKIKEFDDAEFKIVDVEEGRGKMAKKGVFVCETESGDKFKAKMIGSIDELAKYLDHKEDYIDKMLTVKYQGLTGKNGVPRFPVAIRIREDA